MTLRGPHRWFLRNGLRRVLGTGRGHIGEDVVREKETSGEEKEAPRKFTVKGLAEAFVDLKKLLTKFENMDPKAHIKSSSLLGRNVHGALSVYQKL